MTLQSGGVLGVWRLSRGTPMRVEMLEQVVCGQLHGLVSPSEAR